MPWARVTQTAPLADRDPREAAGARRRSGGADDARPAGRDRCRDSVPSAPARHPDRVLSDRQAQRALADLGAAPSRDRGRDLGPPSQQNGRDDRRREGARPGQQARPASSTRDCARLASAAAARRCSSGWPAPVAQRRPVRRVGEDPRRPPVAPPSRSRAAAISAPALASRVARWSSADRPLDHSRSRPSGISGSTVAGPGARMGTIPGHRPRRGRSRERVDVGRLADRFAAPLLRRHRHRRCSMMEAPLRALLSSRALAKPKSERKARSPSTRMLCGLTSRWTMPAAWAASSASATCSQQGDGLGHRQRAFAVDLLPQVATLDQPHRDDQLAL